MKIEKATIIRTVILFLSLINIVLEMKGVKTLPIDNEIISEAVSIILLIVSSLTAWWKNNSFTKNAIKADEYKAQLDRKGN